MKLTEVQYILVTGLLIFTGMAYGQTDVARQELVANEHIHNVRLNNDYTGYNEPGSVEPGNAEPANAESGYAEPGNAESGYAEPGSVEPGNTEPGNDEPGNDQADDDQISNARNAGERVFAATDGYVEFISTAPLLKFKGTSENLAGFINLDTGVVDFYVDLATLDTGHRRRDRDMRRVYLETDKYPFAEFEGVLSSGFDPDKVGQQNVAVTGQFKMRDISREISVNGTMELTEEGLRVKAGWEILLGDYDIDRPAFLFYELSEVQTIFIDILLIPYEPEP